MSRFTRVSILCATAAGAALWLAPSATGKGIALALFAAWLMVFVLGVVCIRLAYFGPAFCRGSDTLPEVALTFDDGPDPAVTPALLDLLAELKVPAVFFCTGLRVASAPELARQIVLAGHLIGNHSHHHGWWTNFLRRRAMAAELTQAQTAIEAATGIRPGLYRPPVGLTNPHLHGALRDLGLQLVGWDVRSFDRNARDPQRVVARVAHRIRPGSIVVLHDGGVAREPLLEAVRGIVSAARARGYRLVRADRMMEPSNAAAAGE